MTKFLQRFLILTLALFTSVITTLPAFPSELPTATQEKLWPNILLNGGFENGTVGWTASGGATKTANATAKGNGNYGYEWDSSAAAQTLLSNSITIPGSYQGKNGYAFCKIKTPSGTATHTMMITDGSSVDLAGLTAQAVTSSTAFESTFLSFVFPTSGSVKLKLTSVNANEPDIYIDDCWLGLNPLVASNNNVTPWVAYTPTISAWSTNTSATGKWRRVGSDLEIQVAIALTGAPTGTLGSVSLPAACSAIDTAAIPNYVTSTYYVGLGTMKAAGVANYPVFVYAPSATAVAPAIDKASGTYVGEDVSITATVPGTFASGDYIKFTAKVPCLGWSAESAYRPDVAGVVWTAFTPTGTWIANTTYTGQYRCDGDTLELQYKVALAGAPTSATLTANLPTGFTIDTTKFLGASAENTSLGQGTVFDSSASARYPINVRYSSTTAIQPFSQRISGSDVADGQNITQALPMVFAVSDSVYFSVRVPVTSDSPCSRVRAPLLVGSVTSNSTGLEREEHASVRSDCAASPCTITQQSGSWLSSVTRTSAGRYVANFVAGIFSSSPDCSVTAVQGLVSINSYPTTSSFDFTVVTHAGVATDSGFMLRCMGPR